MVFVASLIGFVPVLGGTFDIGPGLAAVLTAFFAGVLSLLGAWLNYKQNQATKIAVQDATAETKAAVQQATIDTKVVAQQAKDEAAKGAAELTAAVKTVEKNVNDKSAALDVITKEKDSVIAALNAKALADGKELAALRERLVSLTAASAISANAAATAPATPIAIENVTVDKMEVTGEKAGQGNP